MLVTYDTHDAYHWKEEAFLYFSIFFLYIKPSLSYLKSQLFYCPAYTLKSMLAAIAGFTGKGVPCQFP